MIKWFKTLDYSKKVATLTIVLFAVVTLGFGLVWAVSNKTPEQLSVGIQWVSAVGTPYLVVLTAYMAKSGTENVTKIRSTTNSSDGTVTEQTVEQIKNNAE